ncbi:DOPA 4,5-dioxygenase family protein [Collimonas pratensis]|uniref:DOPA 4,5-dioxygenase family protein n=1 Tax=Collimonas pratensis TaxID=279113 RepID=UPI00078420A9|nr:DOPA 4,5-dioxygenase family protein [Collimonas pratensis]
MDNKAALYHAHIYYEPENRTIAEVLHFRLSELTKPGDSSPIHFIGQLRDSKVIPHPIPQFVIHIAKENFEAVLPIIASSGLRALVHPLSGDDLADHTISAQWIGEPLELELASFRPPSAH